MDKSTLPADSDQALKVRVPGENPPAYNVKLVLEIPAGFTATSCADTGGWTCSITPDTSNGRSALLTWTRQSGGDAVDLFDFAVRTPDKNGTYKFDANQYYSDGKKAFWDGPPGSDNPAPVIEVTGASTVPAATAEPSATPTAPATAVPLVDASGTQDESGSPAGAVALLVAVLGAGGLVAWRLRARRSA